MRLRHGWHVCTILSAFLAASPVRAAPQHVVSANVCADEYVFRLVPRERIAALSYLAADRHPVVSTIVDRVQGIPLIHESAEEILAKHPDLVVTYAGVNQNLHVLLAAAHIAVLDVPWTNSIAQIRTVTRMLGAKLGAPARAQALLQQMDAKLAYARAHAAHPPLRTLVYEPNGYVTAGGATDEIMTAAGLVNAAPQMKLTRLGTLPIEAVIASAPQLLILNGQQTASSRADLLLHHPALAALKGKTRMVWTQLTPLLCPGPWSANSAVEFAKLAAATPRP
jgi:iron complex transport system substrate-binding protein